MAIIIGGNGHQTLNGTTGPDLIIAGNAGDTLSGGYGNDVLIGGNGKDVLDGGSGSDIMLGGNGKDIFIERIYGNSSDHDFIDGGNGSDTLILYLTSQQQELLSTALSSFVASNKNCVFHFGNYAGGIFNLDITHVENLQIVTIGNMAPIAVNDVSSVGESIIPNVAVDLTGNVLVNDSDPDLGDIITVTSVLPMIGTYGTLVVQANGLYQYSFTNTATEPLAQGDMVHDVFAYTISDGQGGIASAHLDITISGTNDAPVATLSTLGAFGTTENASLDMTSTLLANITDVDAHHTLDIASVSGDPHVTLDAGVVTFNPGTDFDHLAQGEIQTVNFDYVAKDEFGALTDTIHSSIIVTGTNDAPVAVADSVIIGDTSSNMFNIITDVGNSGVYINENVNADTDVDHDLLSISAVTNLNLNADGLALQSGLSLSDVLVDSSQPLGLNELAHYTFIAQPPFDQNLIGLPNNPGELIVFDNGDVSFDRGDAFDFMTQDQSLVLNLGYSITDGHSGASSTTLALIIQGIDNDDVFYGTSGDDVFNGGLGDDLFISSGGTDTLNGGDGNDTVDYSAALSGLNVDLHTTNPQNVGGGYGINTLNSIENIIGGNHDDILVGSDQSNVIVGGGGNDTITGGLGAADVLTGGSGSDTFVYVAQIFGNGSVNNGAEGPDIITDFNPAEDFLQFSAIGNLTGPLSQTDFENDGTGHVLAHFRSGITIDFTSIAYIGQANFTDIIPLSHIIIVPPVI